VKARYVIVFAIIIIYVATIAIMLVLYAPDAKVESKHTHTATTTETPTPAPTQTPVPTPTSTTTPTATASPSPTPTITYASNCEHDKYEIQAALDAYYNDHTAWPTANGQSGDIIWAELVPQYMSEMPLIDSSCDWQVSGNPEGSVCVAHTC
jgi:hypothetical protein